MKDEKKQEEKWYLRFENIIVRRHDGSSASPEEALAAIVSFPMWFGENIIKEVNKKKIQVVVIVDDLPNRNYVAFATDDVDLIIRAGNALRQYYS